MNKAVTPERWAFDITQILNVGFESDRFPVDVATLARDYSKQRFSDDPIINVVGDDLPGFDGALFRIPKGRNGWAIIYNNTISSRGRINFTLAHEFGHYLLHRLTYPNGFECGQQKIVRWDSEYGQVEHQANVFAANLLMPLDDFRRQIPSGALVNFDILKTCAERYQVSLIACVLRWLSYTERRAVLVVSVEEYILWARSSEPALRTGAFFKTSLSPIPLPPDSLPMKRGLLAKATAEIGHPAGVWFKEPVHEMIIVSEQYDFSISLLLLEEKHSSFDEAEPEEDVYERMTRMRVRDW